MQTWAVEILYKTELILGEGPHWHAGWQRFLYVDIEGRKVGCIDPVTKIVEERNVDKRVGTVVLATNGNLIVALQGSITTLNFDTDELEEFIKIETEKPANRYNECKCDAAGRLWIGTMHVEAKLHEGALYCYDGSLQKKLKNISVYNGICWSKENTVMYYIDSFDYNIKAYHFELTTGNICNEPIVVKINEPGFVPDGMTVDEEGMLWVAIWGAGAVHRYNPLNGNLIGKIIVAAPNVTSCAFGGTDMQQLLITTARVGLSEAQLQQYPLSGSLFCANTNEKGLPINYFSATPNSNINNKKLITHK